MSGWMRRFLVYLMAWYDERAQFERIAQSREKLKKAAKLQRDATMRADYVRAQSRLSRR